MGYKILTAPLSCQVELTTECNNRCKHCYNYWREQDLPGTFLSEQQALYIIRELHSANVFEVVLTGGEPLMNFDVLVACLHEARVCGMKVNLNSNLVPLNRLKAKKLKELGINGILTSLMGPNAEIHDMISQRKGSFDRAVANIILAQEEGIRVTVNMVVSKANRLYIKDTARFVSSIGVKTFTATKAGCPGNCKDFSGLSLDQKEFHEYLNDLLEAGEEYGLQIDFLEGYPVCGFDDLLKYKKLLGRRCLAGVTTCTIASDGQVRPCSRLDFSYGNIFNENIIEIWKKMTAWRDGSNLPSQCRSCKLVNVCGGGCRMESKMRSHGDILAMDPYAQEENVERHSEVLERLVEIKSCDSMSKEKVFSFVLADELQWRPESFGATVVGNTARSRMFLNHDGLKIFLQFQKGEVYTSDDLRIEWGKVDPLDFLSMFFKKGGIKILK
jgi:radical SAM protein with 4Fe4S-binding SPASM domain